MRVSRALLGLAIPLATVACDPGSVDIRTETNGCVDWDPDDTPASTLELDTVKSDYAFYRTYVIQPADLIFDPELDQDRREIKIREYWVGDGEEVDTCFQPTAVLESPPSGEWTVLWYIGDDSVPLDNRVITVD
jgi:hypothetical protein